MVTSYNIYSEYHLWQIPIVHIFEDDRLIDNIILIISKNKKTKTNKQLNTEKSMNRFWYVTFTPVIHSIQIIFTQYLNTFSSIT